MNRKKYACSCCEGWGWVDDPPEAQSLNYVEAELAYRRGQMKAVWDFLGPNESSDMGWSDEIIIAIENYAKPPSNEFMVGDRVRWTNEFGSSFCATVTYVTPRYSLLLDDGCSADHCLEESLSPMPAEDSK